MPPGRARERPGRAPPEGRCCPAPGITASLPPFVTALGRVGLSPSASQPAVASDVLRAFRPRNSTEYRLRCSQTLHVASKLTADALELHPLPLAIQHADRREALVPINPMYPLDHSLFLLHCHGRARRIGSLGGCALPPLHYSWFSTRVPTRHTCCRYKRGRWPDQPYHRGRSAPQKIDRPSPALPPSAFPCRG
jgi:hypothetical protein